MISSSDKKAKTLILLAIDIFNQTVLLDNFHSVSDRVSTNNKIIAYVQGATKVLSDSPGLVE